MAEELPVELRSSRGKRNTRRLRRTGAIPAILYGHGQETVCLAVAAEKLEVVLRRGGRMVNLTGAVNESALIRESQWDTYGTRVLHVDFNRISADEKVEVPLAVELRGEAPGVKAGGVIEQLVHQLDLECSAAAIPDKLYVKLNQLNVGDAITVAGIEVPAGARILADPDMVVVQCVEPAPEFEIAAPAEPGVGEPELVGRKKAEEEETEDS